MHTAIFITLIFASTTVALNLRRDAERLPPNPVNAARIFIQMAMMLWFSAAAFWMYWHDL